VVQLKTLLLVVCKKRLADVKAAVPQKYNLFTFCKLQKTLQITATI